MPLSKKLEKQYKKFQAKNNLPVYLKGGRMDRLLANFTLGLAGFGLLNVGYFIFDHEFAKRFRKPNESDEANGNGNSSGNGSEDIKAKEDSKETVANTAKK